MSIKRFKILVIEDDEDTRSLLVERLRHHFPGAWIIDGKTVQEGMDAIRQAAEEKAPFDIAILDFKVPASTGHNPEIDESLCTTIGNEMMGTLVVHITGYPDDRHVLRHLRDHHTDSDDSRAKVISKLGSGWASVLFKEIKSYLYGEQIQNQMMQLFEPDVFGQTHRRRSEYSNVRVEGSVTHELGSLHRNIVAHWDDLDERLQQKIQRVFNVDTNIRPIRISLLS